MTSRAPDTRLEPIVARRHRAVRRALVIRHALVAAAACAVLVAVAIAAGVALPFGIGGAWTRVALLALACLVATFLGVQAFRRVAPTRDGFLEQVEDRFPALRSRLRNALDFERTPPRDTSPELARALAADTARRLEGVSLESLTPRIEPRRPALAIAAAIGAIVLLGVLLPARTQRSWATLLSPMKAAPEVRLAVEPGSVEVTPGAALAVRARVWGSAAAPRLEREAGRGGEPSDEGVDPDGARRWRFDLVQLTRPETYRVRVAHVASPEYRISLDGRPHPVSFAIEYRAPGYAALPRQQGAATRGDLAALAGTVAHVEVTFDRDLESLEARIPGAGPARWRALTPRRWSGEVPVRREGLWELHARAAEGEGRFRYRVSPTPDAPPLITVQIPDGDQDLPAGQQVPFDVLAQDDLGLSDLSLQWRKDAEAPWQRVPLARFGAGEREARVAHRWDAAGLALLPGERASFRFELRDNNALGRGIALSPVYELRFPGLADLYERLDERQDQVQQTLEKAAEKARELQKSLDRMGRTPARATPSPQGQSFERREEMKSALDRQQELSKQLDEAARELRRNLEDAAERRAFDERLMAKLREVQELMEQVQSKEFREALRKMREALEKMDPQSAERQLSDWRKESEKMLQNLERTRELLERMREEERLQTLGKRAEELKALQDQLNREMEQQEKDAREGGESEAERKAREALAERQKQAAGESEQLAKDAREMAKEQEARDGKSGKASEPKGEEPKGGESGESGEEPKPEGEPNESQPGEPQDPGEELEKAAEELDQEAAPQQREASEAQQQKQRSKAQKSGQRASQSLQRTAQRLSKMAQQMQQEREGLELAALRRAAQDLVSLQRETDRTLASRDPGTLRADRATDLSEGTSRVADSLFQLARQSPFLTPELTESLGRAILGLSESGRDLAAGNRARGEETGRQASKALNQAVLELRETEQSMCQQPGQQSGSGMPSQGSTAQRMERLGRQQGQLNQRSKGFTQQLSKQMRLQAGDREELGRIAEEQRRIREELERIQRDDEKEQKLLGRLDDAQKEMKEVEEMLRDGSGTPSDLENRQQRILSRMLDAQRSVNRRDFDPERESRAGEDLARETPPELPPDLMRRTDRLKLDLLKSEGDRYPAQYRAFVEAYLRSLNGRPR